ncbi:MAG: hypothetical protein ACOX7D_01415 [Alphaproteobacteria bacterium]
MKNIIFVFILFGIFSSGCTSLTRQENNQLRELQSQGVTVDHPIGNYEKPVSGVVAGTLNLLPGFGNFYLGTGNAADSSHILYGVLNLLFWPTSILWGVPEAAIDADNINKRELLYYYKYDKKGKEELKKANITLTE